MPHWPQWREHLHRWFFALPKNLFAMLISLLLLCTVLCGVYFCTDLLLVSDSDGAEKTIYGCSLDAKFAAKIAGFTVKPEDVLTFGHTDSGIRTLKIDRAFPITITADGEAQTQVLHARTVAEALQAFGITLSGDDYTMPAPTEEITDETEKITVYRVTYRDYTVDEIIPYTTETQSTSLFYKTPNRVLTIQTGQNGYHKADMRDTLVDGVVTQSVVVKAYEDVAPVPEILKVYRAGAPISDVPAPAGVTVTNNVPSKFTKQFTMKATGYSSKLSKGASGLPLHYGTFAVDPRVIPYGSKVYIASADGKFVYGWAIATDTGMFIHKNKMQVDLFYETYVESCINAVQTVQVYVME
ncbi:MAG: 3D domain-containing protein [Ruthenibacterium sp.]